MTLRGFDVACLLQALSTSRSYPVRYSFANLFKFHEYHQRHCPPRRRLLRCCRKKNDTILDDLFCRSFQHGVFLLRQFASVITEISIIIVVQIVQRCTGRNYSRICYRWPPLARNSRNSIPTCAKKEKRPPDSSIISKARNGRTIKPQLRLGTSKTRTSRSKRACAHSKTTTCVFACFSLIWRFVSRGSIKCLLCIQWKAGTSILFNSNT